MMKKPGSALRWMARAAGAAAVVYGSFGGYMYWLMTKPPAEFAAQMSTLAMPSFVLLPFETMWFQARAGRLRVGDEAPDFRLPAVDGQSSFALSSQRGIRPVVLIFGSYT